MKRTELIKNAINSRVVVQFYDGYEHDGWLIVDNKSKNTYLLLPLGEQKSVECESIWSLRVSHIRHLTYINNGYRLW